MPTINQLYKSAQVQEIAEAAIIMERNGFMLDTKVALWGQGETAKDEEECLLQLAKNLSALGVPPLGGVNDIWSSPKQMTALLHDSPYGLGLPPSPYKMKGRVNVDAGERATDKRALEWVASHCENPAAKALLTGVTDLRKVRSCAKYFNKLPDFIAPDGFVHPVTGPAGDGDDRVGAITGRFGMKNPEGQQIPHDPRKDKYGIRKMFIAPPGWKIVSLDYSALEVVVLANICRKLFGDTQLLTMTAPGFDIHSYNAHRVFGQFLGWSTPDGILLSSVPPETWKEDPVLSWYRDAIKEVWYGLMYGKSAAGFGASLKGKDGEPIGKNLATQIVRALMGSVPALGMWQSWCRTWIKRHRSITSQDGRLLDLDALMREGEWGEAAAFRAGYNFPMQAKGAGIVGAAMVRCVSCPVLQELDCLLQLQIHDELMFRVPEENAEMAMMVAKAHMENDDLENLVASGGIGDNWMEAK